MAGAHERPKGPRKQQFDARSYTQRLVVPRDADPREEARRAAERKAQDDAGRVPLAPDAPKAVRQGARRTLYETGTGNARRPRRKKKQGLPGPLRFMVLLLGLVLAVGAAFGVYKLLGRVTGSSRAAASAAAPAGAVKGMFVSFADALGAEAPADQDALLDKAHADAAKAKVLGLNALFIQVESEQGALCRVRGWAVADALSGGFWEDLFHKKDALSAYCQAAGEEGLALYAVLDGARWQGGHPDEAKPVARLYKQYPVAGVYVRQAGDTAGAGRYAPLTDFAAGTPEQDPARLLRLVNAGGGQAAGQFFVDTVTAGNAPGAVFEGGALADAESLGLMASALEPVGQTTLLGFSPQQTLAVSYPADGAWTTASVIYLMGTSAAGVPVTINGEAVEAVAAGGSWAKLVELPQIGGNLFTIAQGGSTVNLTVERRAPAGSSGGLTHDGTVEVPAGTSVRLPNLITSLLYDPSNDDKISETARSGAVGLVTACAETVRSGKTTWAYQLSSGDWVLASNTEALGTGQPRANFTGAAAQAVTSLDAAAPGVAATDAQPDGRTEVLSFAGSGTPLAYTNQYAQQNALSLKFYETDFAADFAMTGSSLVKRWEVKPFENGAELVLYFEKPLWGHLVQYADGATRVVLKGAPARGQDPARPLAGVSVLLDAGHGETDSGAQGVAGASGPLEKDLNLADALAAQARLEQLGAKVHMIRTDDTFLSLEQRNDAISRWMPDFFIAVHHNSMAMTVDSTATTGTECYYFYDTGAPLAQTLVETVTGATGRAARGAKWGYYYVTRNTLCPAVLLEVGFVVNPTEYEELAAERTLWATGDAIARSVLACVP